MAIDDDLLKALKLRALAEGRTVQEVTSDLLRQSLSKRSAAFKLELAGWQAELQPGADIADRDKLFDLMNT